MAKEIKFTEEEVGKINQKDDVQGLMICDISNIKKWFITRDELNSYIAKSRNKDIIDRKYNQKAFHKNF